MQTFLPYPSFKKSAKCLDDKRLNKQIVECYQILKALKGETKGWKNHPATLMWKGYEQALVSYAMWCCWVWKERGFKEVKLESEFGKMIYEHHDRVLMPWWLGLYKFHESHRSNLYRKDIEHYSNFKEDYDNVKAYCWPLEVDGKFILRYKVAGDKNYLKEDYVDFVG